MTSDETAFLQPQRGNIPHAGANALTAPFWEGCAVGELRFQRCTTCHSPTFPPTEHCRNCTSGEQVWQCSTGRARLYSWTVVHRPVTPVFVAPYAAAIVTLAEGYQMMTNIIGVSVDTLRVDLDLDVVFHRVDAENLWLPYFTTLRS